MNHEERREHVLDEFRDLSRIFRQTRFQPVDPILLDGGDDPYGDPMCPLAMNAAVRRNLSNVKRMLDTVTQSAQPPSIVDPTYSTYGLWQTMGLPPGTAFIGGTVFGDKTLYVSLDPHHWPPSLHVDWE